MFLRKIKKAFGYFLGFIYQSQVKIEFPIEVLKKRGESLLPLPEGYTARLPASRADFELWAELLNSDGELGHWTGERVEREIWANQISPKAGGLLFYNGEAVGCGSTCNISRGRKKTGMGMFLYLHQSHRGMNKLAYYITYSILYHFVLERYEKVIATTDPSRFSALALYLANGCVPVKDSLYSHIQWRRIYKRIGPALEGLKKRQLKKN